MQSNHSNRKFNQHGKTRSLRRRLALTAATLACVGFAAAPASANDFRNGFEDQLGRLLAFEAVRAGKVALFVAHTTALHHGAVVNHGYRGDRYYDARDYDRYDRRRHYREPAVSFHFHGKKRCSVVHEAQFRRHDDYRHRSLKQVKHKHRKGRHGRH